MLNNLLTIGKSALTTAQAWVNVTGDNIANANTEGYSRRYVVQNEAPAVNNYAGEIGLGVNAEQILRYFDKFLEDNYINESTLSSRWTEYDNIMETLESIFNESNTVGLSDTLDQFFNSWQKLALNPDDPSVRTNVITNGQTLKDMFSSMTKSIKAVQDEMNISIDKAVTRINEITEGIAKLNYEIDMAMNSPSYSPNSLFDQRDLLVEELATIVDIQTVDSGAGSYHVQLSTGQPLVDGQQTYLMAFDYAKNVDINKSDLPLAENRLMANSTFDCLVEFDGQDDFEYTLQIVEVNEVTEGTTDDTTDSVIIKSLLLSERNCLMII
ncbi:MAG: flagellar hook-associated protein FlgK [Desulfovibrionaceae bacterium]|nr:flagellar hook-associated protein FlgK [Desulfovibrionaceae bacterium]